MDIEDEFDDVEVITLIGESGEENNFAVVDALRFEDINYLLAVNIEQEEENEELEACILKEIQEEGSDVVYEIVEDDEEFEKLIEMFQENDDFDLI